MIKNLTVILDPGHAQVTPGKRSPIMEDGKRLFEWEFNRDIAHRVKARLDAIGINCINIVPENDDPNNIVDVKLSTRAARANKIYLENGKKNTIYISIHANAAGDGSAWMTASGWEDYVSPNASSKSKKLASIFVETAREFGYKTREYSPSQPYKTAKFTVLMKTNMPAILTENFFYDNKKDVQYLSSEAGREMIAELHVQSIIKYIYRS